MKILVFGATGGTGSQLVEQALQQGHTVTAFVRNPEKLQSKNSHLKVIQGDVLDRGAVQQAMYGHDAVICSIGSPVNKIGTVRSTGTKNIVVAMEKTGIRRFICQTSLGYGDSKEVLDRTPFYFKYILVPFILRKGFADHALQENYVKGSQLDWVIVRPSNLTDGKLTGNYKHGFPANAKDIKVKISRADVAQFMLQQLKDDTYLYKTPGLSY